MELLKLMHMSTACPGPCVSATGFVAALHSRPSIGKLRFTLNSLQVYWPYLLMNKKRYAGLLWTKVEKYDKMDTKGLETVRRDNCLLVRKVMNESNLKN